jgi:pSer/pThr/pTyr-binding forkhead associated (FHA) protein
MNANALVLKPIGNGESVNVGGDLIIGRNPDCDLVLQSGTVSGKHARLSLKDSVALLEDLGSTNGTFVNDQRIQRAELKNGDRVRFDVVEFDVVMRAGAATQVRSGTVVRSLKDDDKPPPAAKPGPTAAAATQAESSESPPRIASAGGPSAAAPPPKAAQAAPPKPAQAQAPSGGPPHPAPRAEASAAAPPAVAPKADKPSVAPSATKNKPGSWAFDGAPKGKTQLLTREQLEEMLNAPAAAEQGADFNQPYLQVLSGKLRGNYLRLELLNDTNTWTLGSDAANRDIVLDDAGVSAYHAKLVNEGNRWKVVDQLSQNGTFVNDAKVTARFLTSGDRLKFGSVQCVFRLPGAKEAKTGAGGTRSARSWIVAAVSFAVTAAVLFLLLRWLR